MIGITPAFYSNGMYLTYSTVLLVSNNLLGKIHRNSSLYLNQQNGQMQLLPQSNKFYKQYHQSTTLRFNDSSTHLWMPRESGNSQSWWSEIPLNTFICDTSPNHMTNRFLRQNYNGSKPEFGMEILFQDVSQKWSRSGTCELKIHNVSRSLQRGDRYCRKRVIWFDAFRPLSPSFCNFWK